jgi:hypothetical protein
MNSIKTIAIFVVLCFASLHIRAAESSSLPTMTKDGKKCVEYLASQPEEGYTVTKIAAGCAVAFLLLAVLPGPIACAMGTKCLATAIPTGVVGGIGAIGSTIISAGCGCCSAAKAKKRNVPAKLLELINEAYEMGNNSFHKGEILDGYAKNYFDRHALSTLTNRDLARRIILANEAGFFVPCKAFVAKGDFEQYSLSSDKPDVNKYLISLEVGKLFGEVKKIDQVQKAVDILFNMTVEELEQERAKFREAIIEYDQAVAKFIADAKAAEIKRNGSELDSLMVQ